jgi:hypothetical protein
MAQQTINLGTVADDNTGDPLRTAFDKCNNNFDELYAWLPAMPSYTVATLPVATTAGRLIYVSDESGGAVVAFSDGTNWRRLTDRAVVT